MSPELLMLEQRSDPPPASHPDQELESGLGGAQGKTHNPRVEETHSRPGEPREDLVTETVGPGDFVWDGA